MLPSDWINFFSIVVGAAVALAGLIFVSFSIYNSRNEVDALEQKMGTLYYLEVVASFVIGLAAIAPPHAWWVGAIAISMAQLTYGLHTFPTLREYRRAFEIVYKGKKGVEAPTKKIETQAAVYRVHKRQFDNAWLSPAEATIVFLGGIVGALQGFGLPAVQLLQSIPLYIVGLWAGWYLVSASLGAWYLLFHLLQGHEDPPKH